MLTPDEIKIGLEACSRRSETVGACRQCPYVNVDDGCFEVLRDALGYINQLERRLANVDKSCPEWISVEDRLPDIECQGDFQDVTKKVLAFRKDGNYIVGRFLIFKYEGYYKFVGAFNSHDVTHWMPLPDLSHEIIQNAPPIENQTPNWISLHDTKPKDGTIAVLLVRNCHCLDVSSFQLSVMRNGEWDLDSPWIPTHYIPLPDEIPRAEDDTDD